MSHFKEYKSDVIAPDGRALGDEWADWDGKDGGTISEGKHLFLFYAAATLLLLDIFVCVAVYMISPRLVGWNAWLPTLAWITAICFIVLTALSFVALAFTATRGRGYFLMHRGILFIYNLLFSKSFRLAAIFGVSRDRIGNSFVQVSNSISRAMKPIGRSEKLLILLPRCLAKNELTKINGLKERYPLEVHTVSGGELARKKVRELCPTAVIGVACERDLVSGIRDVGQKISVIGIPNQRPEGPCRNTHIDLNELIEAVEFYVGPARAAQS